MKSIHRVGILVFILGAVLSSAQAQDFSSGGFDLTPVQSPSIVKGAKRPITSMDLLTIRDAKGVSISPDGKRVVFIVGQVAYATNNYHSGLFVMSTAPGSVPVALGTAGASLLDEINQWLADPPKWSPDGNYILRLTRMDKNSRWQVWRWNLDGKAPIQVTNVPGNIKSFDWSPDGSKIVMTFEKPRDPSEARRLAEEGIRYDGNFSAWQDKPVVESLVSRKPLETEVWIHDVSTGEERPQSKSEAATIGPWVSDIDEDYLIPGQPYLGRHLLDAKVSPEGRRVAYRIYAGDTPGNKNHYRLFSKPVRGGTPVDLAPDAYFVLGYWWSLDSSKIYFSKFQSDGEPLQYMVIPAEGGTAKPLFNASENLDECTYDKSFQHMACRIEGRSEPSKVVLADVETGTVRTLVDLNPEFKNLELTPITRIGGANQFGDKWFADIVKPLNAVPGKKYPLIVLPYHTSVFPRGGVGDENPVDVYAAHGFAVMMFDFGRRNFDNEPGDFKRYLSWYESVEASIGMAIQQAAETSFVDTTNLGIAGFSRGESITGFEISHTNLFRAAIGAASYDPYFYYMSDKEYWQEDIFTSWGLGGWPEGKSATNWKQLALELNADKINAAVLNNDPDQEFLADLAFYTSMKQLGKPMELYIYPDERHIFNQPKHRYLMYERNLDWFRFWLQGYERPNPEDPDQYKRWEHLRELRDADEKVIGGQPPAQTITPN